MQQGFTTSLKNQILKYFFYDTPGEVGEPTPLFVGLFIDHGGVESNELVIGARGYERAPVSFCVQLNTGVVNNSSPVSFPKATSDWTTNTDKITGIGIFKSHSVVDADTGETTYVSDDTDELIAFIMLPEAESVIAGETFQFNPQSISLQLI